MIGHKVEQAVTVRALRGATPYIHMYKGRVFVIKAGGGAFRDAGTMRASEREIAAIAQNVVIVATYWMSFQRTAHPAPPGRPAGDDAAMSLERAAYQVLALIAPFTVGSARALIERLGDRYL